MPSGLFKTTHPKGGGDGPKLSRWCGELIILRAALLFNLFFRFEKALLLVACSKYFSLKVNAVVRIPQSTALKK